MAEISPLQLSLNQLPNLPCSVEQGGKIKELFEYLKQGWFVCGCNFCTVQKLGEQIQPVNPIKFLTIIALDPEIKKNCKEALTNMFIGSEVLDSFQKKMEEKDKEKVLEPYWPAFNDVFEQNKELSSSFLKIKNLILFYEQTKSWKELFQAIIDL